jgi:hypothetical protein
MSLNHYGGSDFLTLIKSMLYKMRDGERMWTNLHWIQIVSNPRHFAMEMSASNIDHKVHTTENINSHLRVFRIHGLQ